MGRPWRRSPRDVVSALRLSRMVKLLRVTSVDEIEFPNLDKAFRKGRVKYVIGPGGDLSLVFKARVRGETVSVLHVVFERFTGRTLHLGLKGLKGWDPLDPRKINLPMEFKFELTRKRRKR